MKPYFCQKYGNASEFHALGQQARGAIEKSRKIMADFLGASHSEIVFTGSATESINLSHKGLIESLVSRSATEPRPHITTSRIEHKAVLETCQHLEKLGLATVTYLAVNHFGQINLGELKEAIKPETRLVSIIYVNNEVGVIQPIAEIGQLLKTVNQRIFFHTDATQAIQYLDCDVNKLGVDLLSFTGHKIYAPKGIGVLYKRTGVPLIRQLDGGGQEFRMRAGTENVPYIVGLGRAIELAAKSKSENALKLEKLRDQLIAGVLKIPGVELTGHSSLRAPHIASFIIEGIEGESAVLLLSNKNVTISTGSACNSGDLQPSHVLTAMGFPPEKSHGSLRFSLGKNTSRAEIDYALTVLPKVVSKLRKMAPKF